MEVVNVLHMNGGIGDASYATNSLLQRKVLLMTKSIKEQAISDLYATLSLESLNIVDLGCSSGPNTLLVTSQLIKTIEEAAKKIGKESPEYQIYLNDLFGNDFNAIFMSLPRFREKLREEMGSKLGPCFFNGVPGSFYDRLFPSNSIHFVHSSYSLHWLSKVPDGLENNKGNICIASTSPPDVLKAYYEQFAEDFAMFLKLRSMELVPGGRMVLTILGRKSDDPHSKESFHIFNLLGKTLNDMMSEGIIHEGRLYSFNLPLYTPSLKELAFLVEKDRLYEINHSEALELPWTACDGNVYGSEDSAYEVAKTLRAATEPILLSHFGEAIMDEIYSRCKDLISDTMSKETNMLVILTVAITKKD